MTNTPERQPLHRVIAPSAVALIIAAPLVDALASALHPAMPDDLGELLSVVEQTPRWYAMSLIGLLASALFVGASVALGRLVRARSPILGTAGLVVAFAGGVLMASMQGFKLFLPTLAEFAPRDGAEAIDAFTGDASFIPMIGAFVLRALGLVLLGIAAVRSRIVSWPVGLLVVAGAVLAFQLPAGPDALGWLLVAAGAAGIARAAMPASAPRLARSERGAITSKLGIAMLTVLASATVLAGCGTLKVETAAGTSTTAVAPTTTQPPATQGSGSVAGTGSGGGTGSASGGGSGSGGSGTVTPAPKEATTTTTKPVPTTRPTTTLPAPPPTTIIKVDPNTCKSPYVQRLANSNPKDLVCVTTATKAQVNRDDFYVLRGWQPGGGAYGPHTCVSGLVWREAFAGDDVCVTPEVRSMTQADNAAAASRRVG